MAPREHTAAWTLALALVDAGGIFAAYALTLYATVPAETSFIEHFVDYQMYFAVMVAVWAVQAVEQRLFVSMRGDGLLPQLFAAAKTLFTTSFLAIFLLALLVQASLDRSFILIFGALALVTIISSRIVLRVSLWGIRRRGYNYRRILIVGANERAARIVQSIQTHEHFGFRVVGFLEDDRSRRAELERLGLECLGEIRNMEDVLVERVVDVVYICLPVRSFYETIQSIAHLCEGVGVSVRLMADLFPLRISGSEIMRVGPFPMIALTSSTRLAARPNMLRLVDAAVAAVLLVVLSPGLAVIGALIKLGSSGPVFAREAREKTPGQRDTTLTKFRTTKVDSGETTRIGKFLIRYKLDELPVLLDIGRGRVSVSDPRASGAPASVAGPAAAAPETASSLRE